MLNGANVAADITVPGAAPLRVEGAAEERDPMLDELATLAGPDDTRPPEEILRHILAVTEAPEPAAEIWQPVYDALRECRERGRDAVPAVRRAAQAALHAIETSQPRSPADRVRALIGSGPILHVPTGLRTLDEITRGGLLAGRIAVVGGAPDSGKTSLVVQLAERAAREEFVVAIHCVDEDAEGVTGRIGQAIGLSLSDLENHDAHALRALADYLEQIPELLVADQDLDGVNVEETVARLVEHEKRLRAAGRRVRGRVLVVDSLQTASVRGTSEARTPKDRADLVTSTLKRLARRHGMLVIVTSELGRDSYRSRNPKDRTDPMAAFKESGAIEYAMTIGLVLTNEKGEPNLVRVEVPKNKRGQRGVTFRLRRNPERCTYVDEGIVTDDEGSCDGGIHHPLAARADERLRHVLRAHPEGIPGGVDGLVHEMGGAKSYARAAVNRAHLRREIEPVQRGKGRVFRLREPGAEEPPAVAEPSPAVSELAALLGAPLPAPRPPPPPSAP